MVFNYLDVINENKQQKSVNFQSIVLFQFQEQVNTVDKIVDTSTIFLLQKLSIKCKVMEKRHYTVGLYIQLYHFK